MKRPMIYLLEEGGYYKIGIADNLRSRLSCLQVGNPRRIRIVHAYAFDYNPRKKDAISIEKELHALLADWHVNGEWFTGIPAIEDFFCQFCLDNGGVERFIEPLKQPDKARHKTNF